MSPGEAGRVPARLPSVQNCAKTLLRVVLCMTALLCFTAHARRLHIQTRFPFLAKSGSVFYISNEAP